MVVSACGKMDSKGEFGRGDLISGIVLMRRNCGGRASTFLNTSEKWEQDRNDMINDD